MKRAEVSWGEVWVGGVGFQVTRGVGEFGIGWSGARVRTKEETGEGVGKQVDFLF